jgi:hypothetical protein
VPSLRVYTEGESKSREITKTTCFPNPVDNQLFVQFDLKKSAKLSLRLFDTSGKLIHTAFEKKSFTPGRFEEMIDMRLLNLPTGIYNYVIENRHGRPLATNRFVFVP